MEWLERLDQLPRVLQEQLPGMVLYGTQLRCVGSTFLVAGHVLTVQCFSSPGLLITRYLDRGRVTVIETTMRIQKHYPNT
jgi:regulator of RNase E activity RraA